MTATVDPHAGAVSPAGNPMGFGRMLRKEDARFLRGQGHYLDDLSLPGMLHAAILRSPVAHARITSIDTSAAEAHPKVRAVITGALLETLNLAWMPTLSADVQAVLATDKVRFQGQEVAMVIAEDRYAARDALELIDVEYDVLPAVVDARKALDPDAPVIRDDVDGRTDNHIFDWEAGDRGRTDEVFAAADVVVAQEMLYPRSHPAPMETCGTIASMDKVTGKLTVWSTNQAPHAHRTVYALVAGIPEHNIQIISPDIGGGFGNKVGIYPGYVLAVVGSIVTGKPVKWVEDRSENLMSTSFARDYHMRVRSRRPATARSPGCGWTCSPTTGPSTAPRSRRSSRPGSSTSSPAATTSRPPTARSPGSTPTRRRAAWPTPAPSGSPRPCTSSSAWWTCSPTSSASTLPSCGCGTCCGPSSSRTRPGPAGSTTPATTRAPCARPWRSPATRTCSVSRRRSGSAASSWASA